MRRCYTNIIFYALLVMLLGACSKSGKRKAADHQPENVTYAQEAGEQIRRSTSSGSGDKEVSFNEEYLPVTKIVDGDTFWVNDGSTTGLKVRLIGVDAPESRKVFKKEAGYYGIEAKTYLTNLLQNKRVKLVPDVGPLDRFGRTLSYVYLEDGTFVNAHLIERGYAMVMTVPPNVKFAEEFVALQREARENGRGLWAE